MPLLFALVMSQISQMGIMFHSSQTLSLNDRTSPLVTLGDVSLYIAAAYILSSAFVYFFPRLIVQAGRFVTGIALISALAFFLPLPNDILRTAFIFYCFCYVFMIGIENALITYLFKKETAVRYLTIGYALATFIVALLQNEAIPVPLAVFRFLFGFFPGAVVDFLLKDALKGLLPLHGKGARSRQQSWPSTFWRKLPPSFFYYGFRPWRDWRFDVPVRLCNCGNRALRPLRLQHRSGRIFGVCVRNLETF